MSIHRPPHLDLWELSEELADHPEIEYISIDDDGLYFGLEEMTIQISSPRGQDQPTDSSENLEPDSVLYAVDHGFLEFSNDGIILHEFNDLAYHGDLLIDIVEGATDNEVLQTEEALDILASAGYLVTTTPGELAELMVGWAVASSEDDVLDIATGSGTFLELAASVTEGSKLVGVEVHPEIAKLASTRLKDVGEAEVFEADFFEWGAPEQMELNTGDLGKKKRGGIPDQFDAIVGNPPMGRLHVAAPNGRDNVREWYSGRFTAAAFVAKAVTHLRDGGRGAFLLPKSALSDGLLQRLTTSCCIHRIVELPVGVFPDAPPMKFVLLTLIKEDRPSGARETGLAKFNQRDLPENARGLFEQPLDDIVENRYNPYNAEIVQASHEDLEGRNVLRILSNPPIYDIITSEGFMKFGDLPGVKAGSGLTTGDNDFFYFDLDEKEASGIDDQFFRPVIKNLPDDVRTITIEDIDLYLLDLEPYLTKLDTPRIEPDRDEVISSLKSDGHAELADYISSQPDRFSKKRPALLPNYRGKFENPDLVLPAFFDSPRCYTVEIDDVLFDKAVIGIQTDDVALNEPLARLLNTPLYREFFQTFGSSINIDWYQINLRSLRNIPIIAGALSEETYDRMGPFFPPSDDNDLVNLNQVLIESCESEGEKRALRRYLASRDDFAWSWFMTLPEFEEFQERLESDPKKAREFVVDRFDPELLDRARSTFENIDFFEERRELLNDLLMEFEEGHYRGFLAGIVLQFEGILTDLIVETGGEIIEEDGQTKFVIPRDRGSQTKSLGSLISHFFDGVFSTFLDETVRQRRNRIAHGDVIENSRELSIHFFISFYALCNAALNEYIRQAGQNQTGFAG